VLPQLEKARLPLLEKVLPLLEKQQEQLEKQQVKVPRKQHCNKLELEP
jgi:hypothetical protein